MAMDPAEKALKRIFKKIVDEGIDSNYEYQSILKNHHPSVSFLNNRLMGFAGDILNIRQAFYDEGTKSKLISREIFKGGLESNKVRQEKIIDSYVASLLFGIKVQFFYEYWIPWQGGWTGYGGENSIVKITEDDVEDWWNRQWEYQISENSWWGGEEIKDYLWKDEYLFTRTKTMIPRLVSQLPKEVLDEVDNRDKRLTSMIKLNDSCEDLFVCDDIWRDLNLEKIYNEYDHLGIIGYL